MDLSAFTKQSEGRRVLTEAVDVGHHVARGFFAEMLDLMKISSSEQQDILDVVCAAVDRGIDLAFFEEGMLRGDAARIVEKVSHEVRHRGVPLMHGVSL